MFLLIGSMLTMGCTVTVSSLKALSGGGGESNASTSNDCTWVDVDETTTTSFLFLSTNETRSFDDSLYLCCKGSSGKEPVCHEARWFRVSERGE